VPGGVILSRMPTIFVLGTDHLDNPNNGDLFMTKTEDILTSKRQQEIVNVVDCIKDFHPTKIALEVLTVNQGQLNKDYHSYLKCDFQLTANERHQFGFRLAKEMQLEEIHAVDWNEDLQWIPNVGEWAEENNSEIFKGIMEKGQRVNFESEEYFKHHTIKEYLLWLNHPQNIKSNHETYMHLSLMGNKDIPIGAMWTAQYWYFRNMVIYRNLVDIVESEEDRLLVIYGSGHLHLLNQFLKESGLFIIKTSFDYLN
jgi:hypothetical protein